MLIWRRMKIRRQRRKMMIRRWKKIRRRRRKMMIRRWKKMIQRWRSKNLMPPSLAEDELAGVGAGVEEALAWRSWREPRWKSWPEEGP
jgi:hypothetical protein